MASENTALDTVEEQTPEPAQDDLLTPPEYDDSTEAMMRVLACLRAS